MTKFVGVDKIAAAFRISERAVQRLVIYDGMPRNNRGEYDLEVCLAWYARHLHQKVCGCAGPCDGFDLDSRIATNARADRSKALHEIADLAPQLVGLKEDAIHKLLTNAVELTFTK
jgi:hypothetical protein